MKRTTNSHINAPKQRAEDLKASVISLLNWNDEEYAKLQYKEGVNYLKSYLDTDQHWEDILMGSKIFWSWWKNHWTNRDEEFLSLQKSVRITTFAVHRLLYEEYNDGEMLAGCIKPNSVVLNETYLEMIDSLVKQEKALLV